MSNLIKSIQALQDQIAIAELGVTTQVIFNPQDGGSVYLWHNTGSIPNAVYLQTQLVLFDIHSEDAIDGVIDSLMCSVEEMEAAAINYGGVSDRGRGIWEASTLADLISAFEG
jgi:hypothetical protein